VMAVVVVMMMLGCEKAANQKKMRCGAIRWHN